MRPVNTRGFAIALGTVTLAILHAAGSSLDASALTNSAPARERQAVRHRTQRHRHVVDGERDPAAPATSATREGSGRTDRLRLTAE